jgi:hypothetical protein
LDIWELRFRDGRGASFFTTEDISSDIGKADVIRRIRVARVAVQGRGVEDARRCFAEGRVSDLVAHAGAIAFAIRHTT